MSLYSNYVEHLSLVSHQICSMTDNYVFYTSTFSKIHKSLFLVLNITYHPACAPVYWIQYGCSLTLTLIHMWNGKMWLAIRFWNTKLYQLAPVYQLAPLSPMCLLDLSFYALEWTINRICKWMKRRLYMSYICKL